MSKNVLTLQERIELAGLQVGDSSALSFAGKKMTTATFFIAGIGSDIKSLGNLIDGDTKKKVGYTNFPSGNVLPKGIELGVIGMRAIFDKTTVGVTPLTATWKDNPDAAWLNGNFTFDQGGVTFTTPITDLANCKASTSNDDDFRLINPFKIRSQVEFAAVAELAGAAAASTAWRIEFRCDVYVGEGANA